MTTMEHVALGVDAGISAQLGARISRQIEREHAVDAVTARRIVSGTITFLRVCALNPGRALRPSKEIDIGWHAFILNTVEYADFCQRVAGRFLHHQPEEFPPPVEPAAILAPTVQAIRDAGMEVDETLWHSGGANCSQCHDGCTNCGQ